MSLGMRLRFCAFFCVFLMLAACGNDKGSSPNELPDEVADMDELEGYKCDDSVIGAVVYVKSKSKKYECDGNHWFESYNQPKSSSSKKKLSSSSIVSSPVEGTLTDSRDGQTYKIVKIGDQWWMAENLNYEVDSSFCYNDSAEYCEKYGRLYRWAAAVGKSESECGYDSTCSLPTGSIQGVCPRGWHLPRKYEWETLFDAVGGQTTAGMALKSASGWYNSGNGPDAFGFSALPAGKRDENGNYNFEGSVADFWSPSEYGSGAVLDMYLDSKHGSVFPTITSKYYGHSVRCVKDMSSSNSASQKIAWDYLNPDVGYSELVDDRDGQTYKTVKIGDQWWMAENLNYAYTDVPFNYDGYTSDSTSWCYNNISDHCDKYGRLYTWSAAMDSAGTWTTNGKGCGFGLECSPTYPVRGICPSGWHLPSEVEWETLLNAVGGQSTAGTDLKSLSDWKGRRKGMDPFGFSVLPAGYRNNDGDYNYGGCDAFFWSSTEDDGRNEDAAYEIRLSYGDHNVELHGRYKSIGYSVRCIKD